MLVKVTDPEVEVNVMGKISLVTVEPSDVKVTSPVLRTEGSAPAPDDVAIGELELGENV